MGGAPNGAGLVDSVDVIDAVEIENEGRYMVRWVITKISLFLFRQV